MKIIRCFFMFIIGFLISYIVMALTGIIEAFTGSAVLYSISVYYYLHQDKD